MIIYSETPHSMIKAFLLSKLKNEIIGSHNMTDSILNFSCEHINADDYKIGELIVQFEEQLSTNLKWLNSNNGKQLILLIYYAIRHNSQDKYSVIFKSIEDSIFIGIEYCLQCVSANGRKLRKLARETAHEVGYMLGFIRFKKADENCLVADVKLSHNVLDIVLRRLQNRYPNYRIVLMNETQALSIQSFKLSSVDRNKYIKYLSENDYDNAWKEYYKSQYIESRKNLKLAQAKVPKRYWDWLPEGEVLKEEKNKDEK